MIGRFSGNTILVDLEIASPVTSQVKKVLTFKVDTGFTNDIQITYQEAFPLALSLVGIENYTIADGSTFSCFECFGVVNYDGKSKLVPISIKSNGSLLIGVSLLEKMGLKMEADFVNKTVTFTYIPQPTKAVPQLTPKTKSSVSKYSHKKS